MNGRITSLGKQSFMDDGSDWHESGVPIQKKESDYLVYEKVEQLSQREIDNLPDSNREDILHALTMGKGWLIEPLRHLQPLSFSVMEEFSSELKLGVRWYDRFQRTPPVFTGMSGVVWLEILNRIVVVMIGSSYEQFHARTPTWKSPPQFVVGKAPHQRIIDEYSYIRHSYDALPDSITKSWLWRANSWSIPSTLPGGTVAHQLLRNGGHGGAPWVTIDNLLTKYKRSDHKKILLSISEKIPNIWVKWRRVDASEYERAALGCFLDTRPDGYNGFCGDQLLAVDCNTDKTIYHIHNGDAQNIRVLRDPTQAIDSYCAHILLRKRGGFDFMSWSEPI